MLKWITFSNVPIQVKIFTLFVFIFLFLFIDFLSFKIDEHSSFFVKFMKKYYFEKSINKAKNYYAVYKKPFQTDEFMMLNWLSPNLATNAQKAFPLDPFYRILDKNINVSLKKDEKLEYKYNYLMTDWTDKDVLNALYCDKINYSEDKFKKLKNIRDYKGGYGDTHFLLSLLFLDSLKCINQKLLENEKNNVIRDIIKAQNKKIQPSIDLFAERIVFLYWAGEKRQIKYNWIKRIVDIQNNTGGWTEIGAKKSDYHITGLCSLAIKYYINNDIDNIWFASK